MCVCVCVPSPSHVAPSCPDLCLFPWGLLPPALQTACSHDFVTDICEPKTEPFLAGTISNTTQLATFRKLFFSFTDDNRGRRELGFG